MRILQGTSPETRQEQTMTTSPQTRRTSIYTIACATDAEADQVAAALAAQGIPQSDRGPATVSWRTTDDTAAILTAAALTQGVTTQWRLFTGLGLHRRLVEDRG